MLIVIEGVDGTGKTTLAKTFEQYYGAEVIHKGKPTVHPLIEYTSPLTDYQPGTGRHVICDRWHIGEWVYGPLYRGGSELTTAGFLAVEEFLIARGAVLVWACDKPAHIVQRLLDRDGEAPDPLQLAVDQEEFRRVLFYSRLPRVDYRTGAQLPATAHDIAGIALTREDRVAGVHS